ncbi:MAG: hypothetical protein ACK5Q1_00660, partial [Limnobacter sp.]
YAETSEEKTEQPIAATGISVSEMGLPAEPTQMGSTENNPDDSNITVADVQTVQSVIAAVAQTEETAQQAAATVAVASIAENTVQAPVELPVEKTVESPASETPAVANELIPEPVVATNSESKPQKAKVAAKLNKAELVQMLSNAGMLW